MRQRLGILASHPVQYYTPLYQELSKHLDIHVFYAHRQSAAEQGNAGFGVAFEWDVDLLAGHEHTFLINCARHPSTDRFSGCDTPDIAKHIATGEFDAFLVMGWYLKSHLQAIVACRRQGVPLLVRGDSHLSTPRNLLKRWLKAAFYPLLMRQFAAALPVGTHNRAYYQHYGLPNQQLFSSPHCISNQFFTDRAATVSRAAARAALGISDNTAVILFVGKLLDRKRPFDLLAAAACLAQQREVCVVLAGDGPLRGALEAQAQALNLPVRFLGFCNQTQLPEAYVLADVLCLPSDGSETWGLVCNEALACGTPIVVSDAVGCAPDLALEGFSGAVFPIGDVVALAAALARGLALGRDHAALAEVAARHDVPSAALGIRRAVTAISHRKTTGKV